jgi:transcriptional antiterminator NusG
MANWYVVRTNIKCEKKAERELRDAGFDVYLPEFKVERFNRKRRVTLVSTLCLFPRYLFVCLDHAGQLGIVRTCNGVEDILPGRPREAEPVPAKQVLKLRAAQENLELDDTDQGRRRRGETVKSGLEALRKRMKDRRVRIINGPFASFPGTVEVVESFTRIQVLIQIFGRDTPVELEMDQIEELASSRKAA